MPAERSGRLDNVREVVGGRVSRQVVQQFQDLIRRGELSAGDRLPAERELAERFGVGRNSIREALRELDMIGLVESRHGEGTFVRTPDPGQLMAPFRSVIELSAPAAESVLEFRLTFEPGVAALAARKVTDPSRQRLGAALEEFEASLTPRGTRTEQADAAFHFAIAQATGNPTVVAVHRALLELLTAFRSTLTHAAYQPNRQIAAGHRELYEAIAARDEDRARAVMQAHLASVAGSLKASC